MTVPRTQTGALITRQDSAIVPIPFEDLMDPATGRTRVRMVDISSDSFQAALSLQQRVTAEDLADDIPTLITGVNDDVLSESTDMVAMGSNTSNALAPILRILDDAFGLERAFFTSVHAMTNSERLADVPTAGFRQSRISGPSTMWPSRSRIN